MFGNQKFLFGSRFQQHLGKLCRDLGRLCGDLGTFKVSGLGAVGIWVGTAAFRAPAGARTLLGIWVALSWLGTFRVSGLGVVGIWVGSAAFRGDKTRHAGGGRRGVSRRRPERCWGSGHL